MSPILKAVKSSHIESFKILQGSSMPENSGALFQSPLLGQQPPGCHSRAPGRVPCLSSETILSGSARTLLSRPQGAVRNRLVYLHTHRDTLPQRTQPFCHYADPAATTFWDINGQKLSKRLRFPWERGRCYVTGRANKVRVTPHQREVTFKCPDSPRTTRRPRLRL